MKFSGFAFLTGNMFIIWKKVTTLKGTPHFLRLQLKSFFILLVISLIPEIILASTKIIPLLDALTNNMLLEITSSILFTLPLFFFARRIYHLRFLNLTEHVIGPTSRLTDTQLLSIKHDLCNAKSLFELPFIHIKFFDDLHHLDPRRVLFYLRHENATTSTTAIGQTIEQFMQEKPELVAQFLVEDSILVYDELAFTNFYNKSEETESILLLMEQINAAIVIPLRQKNRFFGALIITNDEKKEELFTHDIQTQMQLYGTFVTYALARFEQASYDLLVEKHATLAAELYKTNQKNARFYETITPLLKQDARKNNGILLYKNSLFTILNTAAEELLQIDPNKHYGHPLTKALKELVRRVSEYDAPSTIIEKNRSGYEIYCQAFQSKGNEIVILLSLANITNTLSLDDAVLTLDDLDYTIFLHGTPSGTTVSHMLPGDGIIMQKTKVHFLKKLLSKKAIFLQCHNDDTDMLLSIAKKVCDKSVVHTIDADRVTHHDEVATLLFGKQHFGTAQGAITEHGFLYSFDKSGIIHIANAHLLDSKTQQLLLNFLKTGTFCLYKSERQFASDATIILSSSDDLELLVQQGKFSKDLYDYLKDSFVTLPNLITLPFAELESIVQSIQKQQIVSSEYHHLFELTKDELEHLNNNRQVSYHALQKTMSNLMKQKIDKSVIAIEVKEQNGTLELQDETILQAARLGKQTLKDRKLMRALWDKLQNQSKIAQILNVDRSSVYRRLKAYGIGNLS